MRLALLSFGPETSDKQENFAALLPHFKVAKEQGAELVMLPEMTLTGYDMKAAALAEDFNQSETLHKFKTLSQELGLSIAFGMVAASEGVAGGKVATKPSNRLVIVSNGKCLGYYDKIHPFSLAKEEAYFQSGERLSIVPFGEWNLGLTVCYDLRFAEIYSALAADGADLMLNIANWPKKRVDHWRTFLKARAIESQSYVAGVNRVGIDANSLEYEKSSHVFAPDGEFIKPYYASTNLDCYQLEKEQVINYREKFPTLLDRRSSLYSLWLKG